jgi:hypothetical protein
MAHADAAGVNGSNRILLSWRSAVADDAEWMSGKSRDRLAFGLDRGFLMDVRPKHAEDLDVGVHVD